jgi:hypothetical protein
MKYTKPEMVKSLSALKGIRSSTRKLRPKVLGGANLAGTTAAYEADERPEESTGE